MRCSFCKVQLGGLHAPSDKVRRSPRDPVGQFKCGACLKEYYCSKICQILHWNKHKKNCLLIRSYIFI